MSAADGAVPSPCVGICRYEPALAMCIGCGRTLDEIGAWPSADQERRAEILTAARLRIAAERP